MAIKTSKIIPRFTPDSPPVVDPDRVGGPPGYTSAYSTLTNIATDQDAVRIATNARLKNPHIQELLAAGYLEIYTHPEYGPALLLTKAGLDHINSMPPSPLAEDHLTRRAAKQQYRLVQAAKEHPHSVFWKLLYRPRA